MPEPKQKSRDLTGLGLALTRVVPRWQSPDWLAAERWRRSVRQQPVAIVSRNRIVSYVGSSGWEIVAKDSAMADEYKEDIEYYTRVLNGQVAAEVIGDSSDDFDMLTDKVLQDGLDLPIGGNFEIVRWPVGTGPLAHRGNPHGDVYKLVHIDGASLYPTPSREFPMAQRVGAMRQVVLFNEFEIGRVLWSARPEYKVHGYGMAPPETGYLALSLLYRGDQYYANLLLDTPEAGVLDLMDMREDAAFKWVAGLKTTLNAIDPMKIAVGYEHERAWNWLPFGRPPTELMFDSVTTKYARVMAAAYQLTLGDIGLELGSGKTLAGQIREERRARSGGFGVAKEKLANVINTKVLPNYLMLIWREVDEEALVLRYRAFSLASTTAKNVVDAGVLTPDEMQAQLKADGLITVEVMQPSEFAPPDNGRDGSQAQKPEPEAERVPASDGGRGDVGVTRGPAEDERLPAVPASSVAYDQAFSQARQMLNGGMLAGTDVQLERLFRAAVRALFPKYQANVMGATAQEQALVLQERLKAWWGLDSVFDLLDEPLRQSAISQRQALLDELDRLLDKEDWWMVDPKMALSWSIVLSLAFSEGATDAMEIAHRELYLDGLIDTPSPVGISFKLSNPRTLAELERAAANLVTRVNDGTKYYLKRTIVSGVEEGLASDYIAGMIADGEGLDVILSDAGFTRSVIDGVKGQLRSISEQRANSIVNTEIARAETDGRVKQWSMMGLQHKSWRHTGATGVGDPCPVCVANIERGWVAMDFMYDSVFGDGTVNGPPAHPTVDHCHLEFKEDELKALADKAGTEGLFWDGS
jgi:predicted kinase